jgi:hypothetical protein
MCTLVSECRWNNSKLLKYTWKYMIKCNKKETGELLGYKEADLKETEDEID